MKAEKSYQVLEDPFPTRPVRSYERPDAGLIDTADADSWRRQAVIWRQGGPRGCANVGPERFLLRAHRCELRADALEQGFMPVLNGYDSLTGEC